MDDKVFAWEGRRAVERMPKLGEREERKNCFSALYYFYLLNLGHFKPVFKMMCSFTEVVI